MSSPRAKKLADLKRGLVLQLFRQRGWFWDAVEAVREKGDIEAKMAMPPIDRYLYIVLGREPPAGYSGPAVKERIRATLQEEIPKLGSLTLPEEFGEPSLLTGEWADFLTACVMFDPPIDRLPEFSEYGGPSRVSFGRDETESDAQEVSATASVRILRDPGEVEIKRIVFLMKTIDELDKSFPEIDVWNRVKDIWKSEGLSEQLESDLEECTARFYIDVREDTTAKDVGDAYHFLKELQGEQRDAGGAPSRDQLVAVQCAIFYDQQNLTHEADRRRRLWTYEKLAERFGLKSKRAAKQYVELGRTILKEKGAQ